eukprot:CAMPEP_0197827226 /NCGR_PEP_ID=MMETSP1437-20131217/4052_1 /TAXON_ID=49252 ORGANISM="Eucampia antarctica, Strain CCMP1452" /NCGR_SAMPLE_ID=MMETSP1437 /ASSEMBLY_ACC=CAM_ASM_001096 /LENGTH=273 /DNA_ID=CAMNT_0043427991 /DNA_START=89 /DNA_END=910 /DNA_ORIENTATION=+
MAMSTSSSEIGSNTIGDWSRRWNPLAQGRNIEMGERLFRAAQDRACELHWFTEGRISNEFRARHSLLTLHIWFLHKRLLKEDDLWLQEEVFDILWNDSKSRIRAVDGIHELTVNKHLKDVQQVTFQHCTHLDHVTTLPLGSKERMEELCAAIWIHILLKRDGETESPEITEQVIRRMAAYVEYQYDNIVHKLPLEHFKEGRVAWGNLPEFTGLKMKAKKIEAWHYEGPSSDLNLLDGWKHVLTDAGDSYYWNTKTNEAQWDVPDNSLEITMDA